MRHRKAVVSGSGKLLAEGRYRQVFEIGPELIGKKMKPQMEKYYGPFRVRYPMELYTALKFGIRDFNAFDFANYWKLMEKVPAPLRSNFGEIVELRKDGKKSVLAMKKAKNFDGSVCKTIAETGPVESSVFWKNVDALERFFIENKVPFFNKYESDMLVQWNSEKEAIPVFVDFKRIGARTYPFKPHLLIRGIAMKRVQKLFARVREKYKPK